MKKYAFPLAALLLAACNSGEEITTTQTDEPVARILEYTPAPGQFINEEARSGGAFDNVDTPEKACRYAAARFAENNWVSLGGWGGYLVAAFAEPVPNTGGYDLYVKGNAMNTSSEPGVVWVMQDANGNGMPDDTWYELKGSEYDNAATIRGYAVTYTPLADGSAAWTDDRGGSGTIDRMDEHTQASYCPAWIEPADLKFTGTRLRRQLLDGGPDRHDQPPAHQRRRDGRRLARQPAADRLHQGADGRERQSPADRRDFDRSVRHRLLPDRNQTQLTACCAPRRYSSA